MHMRNFYFKRICTFVYNRALFDYMRTTPNNNLNHILGKVFLTDQIVQTAICPEGKSQEIYCDNAKGQDNKIYNGSVPGLGLRVTAQGAKSFVHAYRFNGKPKRQVIGSPDHMTVASARLLVQQRNHDLEAGINPEANKKVNFRQKHGETLGEVIEAYVAQHLAHTSAKHRNEFASLVAPWMREQPKNPTRGGKPKKRVTIGEDLRDFLAADITPRHVAPYLNKIQSDSVANSTLRHLKALFNWAIRMHILDMRNPCDPLAKRKIVKQRRDYLPEQVRDIAWLVFNPPMRKAVNLEGLSGREKQIAALTAGHAAQEYEQLTELCNFMGILFLTMARPTEVRHAQFDHFDFTRLVWNRHNTKGMKLSRSTYEYAFRAVPIHPKVAELIKVQRAKWPDSKYVFPNHSDPTQPRDNFQRALRRFKKLDGIPEHFQLYDIRRMAVSMMIAGQGMMREDVSHLLDHSSLSTTMIYDLGFVDPLAACYGQAWRSTRSFEDG